MIIKRDSDMSPKSRMILSLSEDGYLLWETLNQTEEKENFYKIRRLF